MKKNRNGFTLIELLAVIVILGIILTIATTSVIKNINDSKDKAKYIAAKDIVAIAEAYMVTETTEKCVSVNELIDEQYLDGDVTNPKTGENGNIDDGQMVCKDNLSSAQEGYKVQNDNRYKFDGYYYLLGD